MERYDVYRTELKFFPLKCKMFMKYKIVRLPPMTDNFWYDFMQRIAGMKQY
ncbi:hypothetical protein Spock_258 [Bacillus phage Spock]|uniref:Uncharacterized protein n=1 Tax=Bacillus phage Spock TaxID=1406791 RepID=U5Q174_9CAUD|nr:hypothetical protein Spock_258 [Bacillus phage Spock]AGY48658.1 hypothetical protein Spock_258 [Bacillus phage Spock]